MFSSWRTLGRAPSLPLLLHIPHSAPWNGKLLLECVELERDTVGPVSDILKTSQKANRTGERRKRTGWLCISGQGTDRRELRAAKKRKAKAAVQEVCCLCGECFGRTGEGGRSLVVTWHRVMQMWYRRNDGDWLDFFTSEVWERGQILGGLHSFLPQHWSMQPLWGSPQLVFTRKWQHAARLLIWFGGWGLLG